MTLYDYSPLPERPRLTWPDGKRVAFYVGLNIEHFLPDQPSTSIWPLDLKPDPLNHGWREYGARVGIWRTIDILDRYDVRASVLLNSDVAEHNPQIIKAGVERDWSWLAHGSTNSTLHTGYEPDDERRILTEITDTIETATGKRPKGWMGPALTETHNTPQLLSELGYRYVLDWTNDDQPYRLDVPGMLSVPYTVELNDLGIFLRGLTGPDFLQMVKDQYDVLRDESAHTGRVMALALHPFVIGQAFRAKYLDLALEYISAQPDVWMTTSDAIAEHYAAS
ncbi:polysaccharide deacetylase family protein [Kribbella sp. VKM Ac-2566]|uniref:polysaccharide deacetylase family protein n=1 Tax=Kribbella sp. VKM Ac-2566 TaxID=2512218 RepID=UPI0010629755|nr:polysaccharide deacetylase family protein [Kribbella sp. VKM Ac-2566]TDW92131.1 polysaccharide deacetylase [Kribbella sp. VKM Ac-2566]